MTLPLIHTLKQVTPAERETILAALKKTKTSKKDFQKVKGIIERYGGLEYTSNVSKDHIEKARGFLALFPASPYKDALLDMATYIITREA